MAKAIKKVFGRLIQRLSITKKNNMKKIIRKFISFENRIKLFWFFKKIKLAFSSIYNSARTNEEFIMANEFNYFINQQNKENFNSLITNLKRNLDEKSIKEIDQFIKRKKYIAEHNLYEQKEIFSKEELREQKECSKESPKQRKKFKKFIINEYNPESFYGLSSLRWLPENIKEKLKEKKIFFDLGAYQGDSAISLADEFNPKIIYSFEPQEKNFSILKKNAIKDSRICPVKLGLSNKAQESFITNEGSGSKISNSKGEKIEISTIDSFCSQNNIEKIDLIKMDIEGEEMKALIGGKETIKKDRPILAISIYHNPQDFFFIKPWIEENFPFYKFIIKKAHPFDLCREVVLLAFYE